MTAPIDITGQRFGRLTVIALTSERYKGNRLWRVRCNCDSGTEFTTTPAILRSGNTRSCGCSRRPPEKYTSVKGKRAGKLFYSIRGARKAFPDLPRNLIYLAGRNPSRYLRGPKGAARKVVTVEIARQGTYYLNDDLADLSESWKSRNQKKAGQAERLQHDDNHWLTAAQAKDRFGVSRDFCAIWAKQLSRLRRGQKALRSQPVANPNLKGRGSNVPSYYDGDIELILAGHEGRGAGTGKGVNAERLREKKHQLVRELLPEIMPRGTWSAPGNVLGKVKQQTGLGRKYVLAAFRALGGIRQRVNGPTYQWRLPLRAYNKTNDENRNATNGIDTATTPSTGGRNGDGAATAPATEKTRGRPVGSDIAGDQRIFDAWRTREYANYAELARVLDKSEREVKCAVDRERKRRKNHHTNAPE